MTALFRPVALLTAVAGLVLAATAAAEKGLSTIPAQLVVEDNAKMFSPDAIDKAKKLISENRGQVAREVHIETYEKLSDADRKRFEAAKTDDEKRRFWVDWTKAKAAGERGLVIAINRSPGHVSVIPSNEMAKAVTKEQREEIQKRLLTKLAESAKARKEGKPEAEQQKLRDEALVSAMEYTAKQLPASFGTRSVVEDRRGKPAQQQADAGGGRAGAGWGGIGSLICIGLIALLGVWLVIAVVRAFAGGGGGGYGGGGMGGGMGGGGFFPSLLGGLFGAAAGMWMYDHFFGGHSSAAYGGDVGGGGAAAPGAEEQIADTGNFNEDNYSGGDFDGGGDLGGGDFGGGDFGGGDFGGGDF